jgi:predicted transcriptional regulator
VKKVQAGILLPKKQHENFEQIKAEVKEIKDLVNQVLTNFKK